MVQGNVNDGFKELLSNYILNALANVDHGYVYLFTMFLSGLVGMMEKSGGMAGFTQDIMHYARSSRSAQFACFGIGIFIFFDDYANCLLAGETMRPLFDMLCLSREKLSFIVDATAAPIASISPVSSWVGFEVQLIQEQIDRIIGIYGADNVTIKTSGLAVFLQTIKYRYYPIFMIVLMLALIFSERDFGPMLVAERKTRVYQQTDGGAGKGPSSLSGVEQRNQPSDETPKKSWNLVVPILLLVSEAEKCIRSAKWLLFSFILYCFPKVFFIFFLLVKTGEDGTSQTILDKIENSDSFSSLLWGTMATAIVTLLMYLLQPFQNGQIILPSFKTIKNCLFSSEDDRPRFLMTVGQSVESFLYGMGRIFPALIVLTLAWASGSIMIDVGCDRLFSSWIVGGINPEALPTMSFLIAFFMALATGTSWGTMSILFPLLLVPTYEATNGDTIIFYATTAGVLSGSVAGDHMSPISDTTVLSALASDCQLLSHVVTQAPYVIVTIIVSIIMGTVPIGYSDWPNIIGILLGALVLVAFVYGICVPVMSPTGRYDIITELQLKLKGKRGNDSELVQLREDTKHYVAGALPSHEDSDMPKKLESDDSVDKDSENRDEAVAEADSQDDDEIVAGARVKESTHSLDC